jgi:hypothetical protein
MAIYVGPHGKIGRDGGSFQECDINTNTILLPANMDDTAPFAIMSSHHQRAHLAGTGYRSTEPQTTLSNRNITTKPA